MAETTKVVCSTCEQVEERVVEDADYADLQHLERVSQYMVHLETGA